MKNSLPHMFMTDMQFDIPDIMDDIFSHEEDQIVTVNLRSKDHTLILKVDKDSIVGFENHPSNELPSMYEKVEYIQDEFSLLVGTEIDGDELEDIEIDDTKYICPFEIVNDFVQREGFKDGEHCTGLIEYIKSYAR